MRKGITYTAAAVIGLGLIVSAANKQAGAANEAKAVTVAPPVKASAGALFRAYHDNEVAADSIYKGRPVEVAGTVSSITTDIAGRPVVGLASDNEFMPVNARGLDSDRAGKLRKGTRITLACTGGGMVLGSPQLADCAVVD